MAKTKKEKKKNIAEGKVFIQATFNNTIVTITDLDGQRHQLGVGGRRSASRARRSPPPSRPSPPPRRRARKARDQGLREVVVFVKGPGVGERGGHPRLRHAGHPRAVHQGRDADPAQRVPAPEEAQGVGRIQRWEGTSDPSAGCAGRRECRLFLKGDRCRSAKCPITKRSGAPGQGAARPHQEDRRDYAMQLREKQSLKRMYGMLEAQFHLFFERATQAKGVTGENLIQSLERRLDNVVYRMHFAPSRKAARQLVLHGHVRLNGRTVVRAVAAGEGERRGQHRASAPRRSRGVKESLKEYSRSGIVPWLEVDPDKMAGHGAARFRDAARSPTSRTSRSS